VDINDLKLSYIYFKNCLTSGGVMLSGKNCSKSFLEILIFLNLGSENLNL